MAYFILKREVAPIKIALVVLLLISFFWVLAMLAFSFSRNDKVGASAFSLFSTALAFYILGYVLEITASNTAEAMVALRVENLGIPLLSPFFLLTAMGFFQPKYLRSWMPTVCVIYGGIMFLFVFFNNYHQLYYSSVELIYNGSFYAARLGKGPLYYLQQVVSLSCGFSAYIMLAIRFCWGSAKLRDQMKYFIIGSALTFSANLANIAGIVPMGIDPTPLAATVGLLFFSVSLFRYKLMDIVPVAFASAVENMDDAMIILDNDWSFIYCNQKAKELMPALKAFSGTEDILAIEGWPKELAPWVDEEITFPMHNPVTQAESLQRAQIHPICSKRGLQIGVSLMIRDITEITDMIHKLEAMAITDPLTGAFNRRHFMTLVDRQLQMAHRYNLPSCILLLDIDHFKDVNDTYSHLAGDHVLYTLVQTLTRQMRAHDVLARYGGEEFVILANEKEEEGLIAFANRLRQNVEKEEIFFESLVIHITASFGAVMIYPGQTYASAMEAADKALYKAKNGGRNQVVLGHIETPPAQE